MSNKLENRLRAWTRVLAGSWRIRHTDTSHRQSLQHVKNRLFFVCTWFKSWITKRAHIEFLSKLTYHFFFFFPLLASIVVRHDRRKRRPRARFLGARVRFVAATASRSKPTRGGAVTMSKRFIRVRFARARRPRRLCAHNQNHNSNLPSRLDLRTIPSSGRRRCIFKTCKHAACGDVIRRQRLWYVRATVSLF